LETKELHTLFSLWRKNMSGHNGNSWKDAAIATAVAGGAFAAGALIDAAISSQTKTASNAGKLGAAGLLAALHLNEAAEILNGWSDSTKA
jgi:hypothetical protein